MTEIKKSDLFSGIQSVLITILLILVIVTISSIAIHFYNRAKVYMMESKQISIKYDQCIKTNKEKEIELQKTKERVLGIKDKNDLLIRDIEIYIKSTYRKVPRIIAKNIATIVVEVSKKENMAAELIIGIIQVESSFNPMAVGPKTKYGNARGLMQVMPEWAKKFGLESMYDLHDIDTNIQSGVRVFKIHLGEADGDISEALYLYVNKDRQYVNDVYNSMGKFVTFRSTIDDNKKPQQNKIDSNDDKKSQPESDDSVEDDKEGEKDIEPVATTKNSS